MSVFLHIIAFAQIEKISSVIWNGLEAGSTASGIWRAFLSFDEASFIGFAATVVVVATDSVFLARLWSADGKPGSVGEETFSDLASDSSSSVTTTIRAGLWAILGLTGVLLGGLAFGSTSTFGNVLRHWPDQLTLSAVVIAMALILSAIILASVVMLTARLNAVAIVSNDEEKARLHVTRAARHLAAIANYRRKSE